MFLKINNKIKNIKNIVKMCKIKNPVTKEYVLHLYLANENKPLDIKEKDKTIDEIIGDIKWGCDKLKIKLIEFSEHFVNIKYINDVKSIDNHIGSLIYMAIAGNSLYEKYEDIEKCKNRMIEIEKQLLLL